MLSGLKGAVGAGEAAMIAAGAPPEVAATSFRNLVKALTKGDSATKRQSDAMTELGLTTKGVAAAMQKDASGTTMPPVPSTWQRLGQWSPAGYAPVYSSRKIGPA